VTDVSSSRAASQGWQTLLRGHQKVQFQVSPISVKVLRLSQNSHCMIHNTRSASKAIQASNTFQLQTKPTQDIRSH